MCCSYRQVREQGPYFDFLLTYARCHRYRGKPYIGEYLDEQNGTWLKPDSDRSRYYNHSTFCDLVISGLAGLVPREDSMVVVDPLVPPEAWDWFCLDNVSYHGRTLTILWDRTGARYHKDAGLRVFADGVEIARADELTRVTGKLPLTQRRNRDYGAVMKPTPQRRLWCGQPAPSRSVWLGWA
jgi:hypothetical protein